MRYASLATLTLLSLSVSSFAQYSGPTNTLNSGYGSTTFAGPFVGPGSFSPTFTATSYSKCWQATGSDTEPISWNLAYQSLYDNTWSQTFNLSLYVATGHEVYFRVPYQYRNGSEEWIRNSDSAVFRRQQAYIIYGNKAEAFELE